MTNTPTPLYPTRDHHEWLTATEPTELPTPANRLDRLIVALEATTEAVNRLAELLQCDADDLVSNLEGRDDG